MWSEFLAVAGGAALLTLSAGRFVIGAAAVVDPDGSRPAGAMLLTAYIAFQTLLYFSETGRL